MEKIGPRESSLTASATSKKRGKRTAIIEVEMMMSNTRFAISCGDRAERVGSEGVITKSFSESRSGSRSRSFMFFHSLATVARTIG
jgi:hypothetical protein